MTEDKDGFEELDCPIGMKVCYQSCYFWRGKCAYEQVIKELWPHRQEFRNKGKKDKEQ